MLTTCRYFDIVGNRCSRVTCGKCDDLPDCEFKYIEELKAENATYKANADAVQKYITQNEQLKTHIDVLEKKNAELKAENEKLKGENHYYKAELKLTCNELDKSEKWQIFERRKKNECYTALKDIEKLFKKEYTRLVFRNCFGEYPKECKRCLHNGSCLQQQVLNIINSTKAEEE